MNVAGLFQNLPNNTFNGSRETSGVAPQSMGPQMDALTQAKKYGWPFPMVG